MATIYFKRPILSSNEIGAARPPTREELIELQKDRIRVIRRSLRLQKLKKLSRWFAAAAQGEDIGVVSGADIIALRKIEVESTDYAQREYAATREQIATLDKATDERYRKLRRSGKHVTVSAERLRVG